MIDEITTERLLLRPLTQSDREELIRVHQISEKHFAPWLPASGGGPEERFDRELEKAEEGRDEGTHAHWVGVLGDGGIGGFFSLTEIVRGAFQSAYAGWSVSAEVTGRGSATEGVLGLLDLAFSDTGLGLHRVQANIIPSNAGSVRVAEKAGMRREGLARRYLRIAGQWEDHLMYAKTVEEHSFSYL